MEQKKAWAASDTAKEMQGCFICLAHNLMLIMEEELKTKKGIENRAELKRKEKRLYKAIASAEENGTILPLHLRDIRRFTQRSVKFVRWLRNNLFNQASWHDAAAFLKVNYSTL